MIKNCKYSGMHYRDAEVIEFIKKNRELNRDYKVIDIGTSINSWCISELDASVDIADFSSGKMHFKGNINYLEVWEDIIKYTEENGKFDFSICTHTLEDISNPGLVSKMLSKISKSGFIAFPSKYVECGRWHGTKFKGWIHHRWIFNYENDKIVAYPKLPFTEYLDYLNQIVKPDDDTQELSFFWEEYCDIEIINDDYFPLGEPSMIEAYKRLLN